MNLTLYRSGAVSCAIIIDDKTTVKRRLMVENTIVVSVAVPKATPIDVRLGDYADIQGERYVVMDTPSYKLSNGVYDYSILLRGDLHRLELYMMPDSGRDEWWYYGGPVQQIDKVIAMLNTKESGWSAVYPDLSGLPDTSPKNINYANMSVLSALHAIASAENGWGLEFDIRGKVVRFARQIKTPTTLRFEYGRGKGLYELTRGELSSEKLTTRVVAYGASTNMPNGHRLSMGAVNNHLDYVDCRTELYGIRETRINYDHIYPRRNASITSNAVQVEVGKANWRVVDTTLDFDLNAQVVEGAVLLFNSGDCVGVEFEIVHYDPATKTITFKEYVDQSAAEAYVLPNASRSPKAGDAYILVNILMPDSYVAAAQRELKAAAAVDADRLSQPQYSYSVDCDPRFIRTLSHRPVAGDACRIVDAPHGVDYTTRIVGVEYPIIDPTRVKLTLAEKVAIPSAVVLAKSIKEVKTKLGILDRGQLTEAELRKIFHPLGGSPLLDFGARKIETSSIESPVFGTGIVRSGFRVSTNPDTNRSTLEIGKVVADELVVDVLTLQKVQAAGGVIVLSEAWAELTQVERVGGAYRCSYKPDPLAGEVAQFWRVGDQALCKNGGKYYWRLVTSVSEAINERGEHWFNLSQSTTDGDGVPAQGDGVVLLGHRGDNTNRRSATVLSSGTLGYPNPITHYKGINSFSLAGREQTVIGEESRFVGRSFTIESPSGERYELPTERGGYVAGVFYDYYSRVSHGGQMWLCIAPAGTSVEPTVESAQAGLWLLEIAKGDKGEGWRYPLAIYRWTDEANPAKPMGVDAPNWTTNPVGGRVVTDQAGRPLVDKQGQWIVAPYPKTYRLWGSTGIFDGATDALLGDWGTPYPISGIKGDDGKDGQDGKDVDPGTVERLEQETRRAKAEAINAWVGGAEGSLEAIEQVLKGAGAPFAVVDGVVVMRAAFAQKLAADNAFVSQLEVEKLNTKPKQQTKRVEIKEDTVSVYDTTGRLVATFNGSAMPSKAEFDSDGASGSVSADSATVGAGNTQTLCSLVVTKANSTLRVQSDLWFYFEQISQTPSFGATLLELRKDGAYFAEIGSATSMGSVNAIDVSLTVPAGTYSLVLECRRFTSGPLDMVKGGAYNTTMSFRYASDALLSMFAADGYGMRANKFSYEHTWFNPAGNNGLGQLEKTFKGKTDMPGVLAKARIGSDGFISKKWGAHSITSIDGTTLGGANKRLYHNVGHDQYSAICTPYGRGNVVEVINETTAYVDVYASGGFNIELTGNNQ